jgi:hypothetical protein
MPCPHHGPPRVLITQVGTLRPAPAERPRITPGQALALGTYNLGGAARPISASGPTWGLAVYATYGVPVWIVEFHGTCVESLGHPARGCEPVRVWDVMVNAETGEWMAAWGSNLILRSFSVPMTRR